VFRRGLKLTLPGLFLAALVGVLLGIGADTFYYANGTAYLSNDPAACVNCHIMRDQYDSWRHGPHHANATCNDCHVPHDFVGKWMAKAEHGYRHSKAFTLQNFHEPIQITPADRIIVRDNCVRCHEAKVSQLPGVIGHEGADSNALDCIHCHSAAGHGFRR
jgi:cytochrome c nitrite reductase small subunit